MRVAILSFVAFVVLLAPMHSVTAATPVSSPTLMAASYQDQQPTKEFKLDINVNKGSDRVWYANPIWVAVGAVGLMLFIALIVMASRGGGTTIVKE